MNERLIEGVDHVQLPVPDIDKAIQWYTEVLGLELISRHPNRLAWLKFGHGPILMLHYTSKEARVTWNADDDFPMPAFMFISQQLDKLRVRLKEAGATIRMDQDEGFGWVIKFVDPFGNELGVYQPK